MPDAPPKSSPEEADSTDSFDCGSDTEGVVYDDWRKESKKLEIKAGKLKAQLEAVERERKVVGHKLGSEARNVKRKIEEVELEGEMRTRDVMTLLGP